MRMSWLLALVFSSLHALLYGISRQVFVQSAPAFAPVTPGLLQQTLNSHVQQHVVKKDTDRLLKQTTSSHAQQHVSSYYTEDESTDALATFEDDATEADTHGVKMPSLLPRITETSGSQRTTSPDPATHVAAAASTDITVNTAPYFEKDKQLSPVLGQHLLRTPDPASSSQADNSLFLHTTALVDPSSPAGNAHLLTGDVLRPRFPIEEEEESSQFPRPSRSSATSSQHIADQKDFLPCGERAPDDAVIPAQCSSGSHGDTMQEERLLFSASSSKHTPSAYKAGFSRHNPGGSFQSTRGSSLFDDDNDDDDDDADASSAVDKANTGSTATPDYTRALSTDATVAAAALNPEQGKGAPAPVFTPHPGDKTLIYSQKRLLRHIQQNQKGRERQPQLIPEPRLLHPNHTSETPAHSTRDNDVLKWIGPQGEGPPARSSDYNASFSQQWPLYLLVTDGPVALGKSRGSESPFRVLSPLPAGQILDAPAVSLFPSAQLSGSPSVNEDAALQDHRFNKPLLHRDDTAADVVKHLGPEVSGQVPFISEDYLYDRWFVFRPEHMRSQILRPSAAAVRHEGPPATTQDMSKQIKDDQYFPGIPESLWDIGAPSVHEGLNTTSPLTGKGTTTREIKGDFPSLTKLAFDVDLTQYGENPAFDYIAYTNQRVCRGLFYDKRTQSETVDNTAAEESSSASSKEGDVANAKEGKCATASAHAEKPQSMFQTYLRKLNISRLPLLSQRTRSLTSLWRQPSVSSRSKKVPNGPCLLVFYLTSFEESMQTCLPDTSPSLWAADGDTDPQSLLLYHKRVCRSNRARRMSLYHSLQPAGKTGFFAGFIKYMGVRGCKGLNVSEREDAKQQRNEENSPFPDVVDDYQVDAQQHAGTKFPLQERPTRSSKRGGVAFAGVEGPRTAAVREKKSSSRSTARRRAERRERRTGRSSGAADDGETRRETAENPLEAATDYADAYNKYTRGLSSPVSGEAAASEEALITKEGPYSSWTQTDMSYHEQAKTTQRALDSVSLFQAAKKILCSPVTLYLWRFLQQLSQQVQKQQEAGKAINMGFAIASAVNEDSRLQHIDIIQTATTLRKLSHAMPRLPS